MGENEMLQSHGANVAEYADAKKRLSTLRGNIERALEDYASVMEQIYVSNPQDYKAIASKVESLAAPDALAGYLIESADLATKLLRAKKQLSNLGLDTAEDCLDPMRPKEGIK